MPRQPGNSSSMNSLHTVTPEAYNQEITYGINSIDCSSTQFKVIDLFEVSQDTDKYIVPVHLNGKLQNFEVDSGAKFSLLSETDFNRLNLNLPLENSNIAFRTYSGDIIQSKGKVHVNVAFRGKKIFGELHIVPAGCAALLGRQWIRGLGINLQQIDADTSNTPVQRSPVHQVSPIYSLLEKFSPLFEERVGCVPNFKVSLQLRDGVKPVFTRERDVPYALRERVNKELDSLEADGVISLVPASDWGSPLVVIPKPNGGVRLCVDYKCGVNERLIQSNHPVRRIDDVFHSLRNSRYFCKLDLFKAYLHLNVDEDSSMIQTISTHRGTYCIHRLSFGIKTAPSEFNRILSQILKGLPKTESYFDDIIVHGETLEEFRILFTKIV
ncbi:uncharacterized protein K02A2.6-like [Uloborus diversus]|uniref:uncharacterized protein K02A2.6-like n=1 Tax=Uloborus diversus TaxID=327109 RepID=UPI00240A6ADE|nr:uncharacterized protein K02A2.6-like [Uloborus diversus]